MKVPKVFIPEKNLDEKVMHIIRSFDTIKSLIIQDIGGYWKERECYPDPLITEYKHIIPLAVECANVQYGNYWKGEEVSMTIFKLKKSAKDCMEEILKELEKGLYKNCQYKYCMIKQDFVVVLKTSYDVEGLEIFKKHYQKEYGFY